MFLTIKEFESEVGSLTEAEIALIDACRKSKSCILNRGRRPGVETDAISIRADLLRLVITGAGPECGLRGFGVHLVGAWIKGGLDLSYACALGRTMLDACHFTDRPCFVQTTFLHLSLKRSLLPGLEAKAMVVKGAVSMRSMLAVGEVNMPAAHIDHKLDLTGAKLEGRTSEGKWGRALYAERAQIGNSVFLRRVKAIGRISLVGARVGGQLSIVGGKLEGRVSDGRWDTALNAERMTLGASILLTDLFSIGSISLNGADVGGQLICQNMEMDGKTVEGAWDVAFRCERIEIKERFVWRQIKIIGGRINLISAHVGALDDDMASWPTAEGQLRLDGFVYQRLTTGAMVKTKERLAWLAKACSRDGAPLPQPYTQLARTLRSMGHDRGAEQVLIERERLMAKQARLDRVINPNGELAVAIRSGRMDFINIMSSALDALLRGLTGYGYRAHRSFFAVVVLFFLAWALAATTWNEGSFAPNSDVLLTSPGWRDMISRDCLPDKFDHCVANPAALWSSHAHDGFDWESFHPAAYAADLVVPILDLGQTEAWAPSRDRGPWGTLLWWARWVFAGLGLGLSALGTAAVTKIIQKDRE